MFMDMKREGYGGGERRGCFSSVLQVSLLSFFFFLFFFFFFSFIPPTPPSIFPVSVLHSISRNLYGGGGGGHTSPSSNVLALRAAVG